MVIGSSLSAVLYAFNNNLPIFFTQPLRPFRFDYFDVATDLAFLKLSARPVKSLTTFDGVKLVGQPKELLWERLLFLLSLDGKVPLSNLCHSIRYDGKSVVCSNEYSKIMEFKFDRCHYYGDEFSFGFVEEKPLALDDYLCYDYIAFNKGGKHEIDYIKTEDSWVSEIWLYPSDRIDGATPVKDACVVSRLSKAQLTMFEYSETMTRFKLVSEMEKRGMKGVFNGYTTSGKPKHYKFKTSHTRRDLQSTPGPETSKEASIICSPRLEKDLLSELPSSIMAYDRFLKHL
jgi:hypothetical protein